jgi:hypothetical protein
MASVRCEIVLELSADRVWAAVRDFDNVHRMVPGFLTDCRPEPGARVVTFGNGLVARELLVSLDDAARRLVWSARGTMLTHHNGAMQVRADGPRAHVEWTADVMPDAAARTVRDMMEDSLRVMKRTLEGGPSP